jgi:hypothetical protein
VGAPLGGALSAVGGASLYRDMLIFNEIWAQDKIYILVGTSLG